MPNNILWLFYPVTMEIVQQSLINSTGVMFAAYTYQEDFILYGEVEIYRVSRDLLIKWIFL